MEREIQALRERMDKVEATLFGNNTRSSSSSSNPIVRIPGQIKIAVIRTKSAQIAYTSFEDEIVPILNSHLNVRVVLTRISSTDYSSEALRTYDMGIVVAFTAQSRTDPTDILNVMQDLESQNIPRCVIILRRGNSPSVELNTQGKKITSFNLAYTGVEPNQTMIRDSDLSRNAISGLVAMIKSL